MADLVLGWTSTERCDLPWGLSPSKVPASFCKHARDPTRRSYWVPGARTAVQSAVVRAGNVHKNKESDCLGGTWRRVSYATVRPLPGWPSVQVTRVSYHIRPCRISSGFTATQHPFGKLGSSADLVVHIVDIFDHHLNGSHKQPHLSHLNQRVCYQR